MPLGAPNRFYKHARVCMRVAEIVPAAVTPVRLLQKNFVSAWLTSNLCTHKNLLCHREWGSFSCREIGELRESSFVICTYSFEVLPHPATVYGRIRIVG